MKISINWIKEYIDLPVKTLVDANKLAEQIGLTSSEVEDVRTVTPVTKGLVVAQVLEVSKVQDSDHLQKVVINDGSKLISVVTGAPNVKVNQLVVFAPVGTTLFDGKEVKSVEMAGEESNGMLVSLQEIGFNDSIAPRKHEEGIYVFPNDQEVKPGDDATRALWQDGLVIETSLTANRADMLSIKGNAYEFGAMLNIPVKGVGTNVKEGTTDIDKFIEQLDVDPEVAPFYNLRVIDDVTVQDSPLWLQRILWSSGIRPINNVVDATNYTMLLFGQPQHAFDYQAIEGKQIKVDQTNQGSLTTLDGIERNLEEQESIVVYDSKKPLALAGVMGGEVSQVTNLTKTVVLETAILNPQSVRKTAQKFALHSESSTRFERGIDIDDVINSLNFTANLISQIAGGKVARGIKGVNPKNIEDKQIIITVEETNAYLGTQLNAKDIASVFDRLAFGYTNNANEFIVDVPHRRWDINLPVDLIEEIIRIHGYDKLPASLPQAVDINAGLDLEQKVMRVVTGTLMAQGLNQAMSYSLTTSSKATEFTWSNNDTVALDHPISEDRSDLRQSVVSTLIEAAKYNLARNQNDINFFEVGQVFIQNKKEYIQQDHIGGVVSRTQISNWKNNQTKQTFDFYDAKGIVDSLFNRLNISVVYQALDIDSTHPGQTAGIYLQDKLIGFVGRLHPLYEAENKLPETYVFELNANDIVSNYKEIVDYQEISKFPEMTRDISMKIPEGVTNFEIQELIWKNSDKHLKSINVVDVYENSYTYHLVFDNRDNDLTVDSLNQMVDKINLQLANQLRVEIR